MSLFFRKLKMCTDFEGDRMLESGNSVRKWRQTKCECNDKC